MEKRSYDVVIIGGGASGMVAAIELKMSSPDLAVAIVEKNDTLGRKIRATGSGRCNITNTSATGYTDIMAFFRRIGLVTRTYENGLVYPYSESAADVTELLNSRIAELGIAVITNAAVTAVEAADYYTIHTEDLIIGADKVILALGGKAGPNYGTTGDGYAIARSLGHSIVTPIPVLTAIECREWDKIAVPCAVSLGGIRARGRVSLYKDGALIFEESGEIQFTKFGMSGICIFNMTRCMRYNRALGESLDQFVVKLDLFEEGNIEEYLEDRRREGLPEDHILRTILKEELAEYVMAYGPEQIHKLEFHPTAVRGWKEAQATSGGVSLDEIDHETSESRVQKGLYITGELLDYDGPCGGYNLSNAWLTGIKAARDIKFKNSTDN